MKILVGDLSFRRELEPLPEAVCLVAEPEPDVEFVVLGPELTGRIPAVFDQLPRLRVVQALTAGVDGLIAAVPAGVTVCSASGAHDIPVSEWVVAVLLALQRRLPEFIELQRRSEWNVSAEDGSPLDQLEELWGANVLILGYGSIGRAVAARLIPFGVNVVGVTRQGRDDTKTPDALPQLLPEADAVVVLLPLTPETDRVVDAVFLAHMKPGALLVNAARGRVVDTAALLESLHAGHVRAALDVTDPEPLPPDHPLWRAPNVLITPHVASSVEPWRARAYRLAGEQIRRYAANEPLLNVRSGDPDVRRHPGTV